MRYYKAHIEKIHLIEKFVSESYGLNPQAVKTKRRDQPRARARQVCIYLAREIANLSWPCIGQIYGLDHTTCIYAHAKIAYMMSGNQSFTDRVRLMASKVDREFNEAKTQSDSEPSSTGIW